MARIEMNSGSLNVDIILPCRGREEMRSLPVLWLSYDSDGFLRRSRLELFAEENRMAVIISDLQMDAFHRFPFDIELPCDSLGELRKLIMSVFPLSEKAEDNYIGGIDAGGTMALSQMLARPDMFGTAIVLFNGEAGEMITLPERKDLHSHAVVTSNKRLLGDIERIHALETAGCIVSEVAPQLAGEKDVADSYAEYFLNAVNRLRSREMLGGCLCHSWR